MPKDTGTMDQCKGDKMPDKPPNPRPRSATDPELMTMIRVDKLLGTLPQEARARVIGWLVAKYLPKEPQA